MVAPSIDLRILNDMWQPYAHDAILIMDPDGDVRAPGAAITTALCGHWEHQPPCRLAAHHTEAERYGDEVRLHILFATEPEREDEVRRRIDGALTMGLFADARWRLAGAHRSDLTSRECAHATRLTHS